MTRTSARAFCFKKQRLKVKARRQKTSTKLGLASRRRICVNAISNRLRNDSQPASNDFVRGGKTNSHTASSRGGELLVHVVVPQSVKKSVAWDSQYAFSFELIIKVCGTGRQTGNPQPEEKGSFAFVQSRVDANSRQFTLEYFNRFRATFTIIRSDDFSRNS